MGEIYETVRIAMSNIGKPPLYKRPEDLADKFVEYAEYCDAHPIDVFNRVQATQQKESKNASQMKAKVGKPLTISGFLLYAGIYDNWTKFKQARCRKTGEYVRVIHAIEESCRNQQLEGAIVGVYKENLVARLNGVAEKVETSSTVRVEKPLTPKEAAEILRHIEEDI